MPPPLVLHVNGHAHAVAAEPGTPLIYVLRNDLGLKGTRFGCGEGECGACNVLVDGRVTTACNTPVDALAGRAVTTIEGVGTPGALHPVQQAFLDEQALQCGYCIDGIIVAAVALIARDPDPTDAAIAAALHRNLCRCGAHVRIRRAIRRAAAVMRRGGGGA